MGMKVLLSSKQFLLRGARLKNTKWVVGIVSYTGNDTKIMMNADKSKYKQSNIERLTNSLILSILTFQFIVSLVSAIGAGIWSANSLENHYYLNRVYEPAVDGLLTFLTYVVLNNTMIPISLIVSLEIVKGVQGYLI
jgi:phospholipid-transporting ATPase